METSTLIAESITFSYHKTSGTPQFGPFSFVAKTGQIWAILGSNGSGKSTLMKLLSGEYKPLTGNVIHSGTIELIPQGLSIPGRLTIYQAFEYLAILRRVPRKIRHDAVSQAITDVNLQNLSDSKIHTLSGGQQRRAAVGQALVASPSILLMDEPSAGLDIDQRADLRKVIARLGQNHLVMISSHIVEDLAGLATNVLHLANGSVTFSGSTQSYLNASDTNLSSESIKSTEIWTNAYRFWNTRERADKSENS